MITNMQYLCIYEHAIDNAVEICECAMKDCGFSEREISDMHNMAREELTEIGDWSDITNSIISAYFITTESLIKQKYEDASVSFEVNCDASYFNYDL